MREGFIRNCAWGYSCTEEWRSLTETTDPKIRFCNTCQREVHHSSTTNELVYNVTLNRCVYFPCNLMNAENDEHMLLGDVDFDTIPNR